MLRKNEFEQTLEMLRDRLKLHVIGVDASDRFLAQLKGVTDPRKSVDALQRVHRRLAEEAQKLQAGEATARLGSWCRELSILT